MALKTKQIIPFSPYHEACKMGAIAHSGGINWSYATFTDRKTCDAFASACNHNGYRTRSLHSSYDDDLANKSKVDTTKPETWSVQYHHYQD